MNESMLTLQIKIKSPNLFDKFYKDISQGVSSELITGVADKTIFFKFPTRMELEAMVDFIKKMNNRKIVLKYLKWN